jgi:uroporphyrinogen-III synthase
MAVLLTRPHPDNDASAARLRERGLEVLLAPMLRFEPIAFEDDPAAHHDAVIVTSANALRAISPQLQSTGLAELPLFAVGDHTAASARELGFHKVISAEGDASALRQRLIASARAGDLPENSRLLYLAGADVSRDLASELRDCGLDVAMQTTYRMAALSTLPRDVCEAFAASKVHAVLHYSKRSAAAFLRAVRTEGIEISALAVPQCCMSGNVAAVLHEAGALRVSVAGLPNENALFEALDRALRSRLA